MHNFQLIFTLLKQLKLLIPFSLTINQIMPNSQLQP